MDTGRRSYMRTAGVGKIVEIQDNVDNDTTVPIIIDKRDSVDRISQLPDDVVMHIFSFLTPREIIATRTLGKMWARFSPGLKLSSEHFIENKADEVFESYKYEGALVKTCFLDLNDSVKYSTCINDWLELVSKNDMYAMHIRFGFQDMHFCFSLQRSVSVCKDLVVLSLQNLFLNSLIFTTKLHSLEELSLENVKLSVDQTRDFKSVQPFLSFYDCYSAISAWYNIRRLRLKDCFDLSYFYLTSFHRLEEVEIDGFSDDCSWTSFAESYILNNSNVKKFVFRGNAKKPSQLCFEDCKNLETLQLHVTVLPYLPKELLVPKADEFPLLKKLVLRGRHGLEKRFSIDRSTLEVLHLCHVSGIESATINTPRLHTFKFTGMSFEPFMFTMNTGTLQKISLKFHEKCAIDNTWYWNLCFLVRNLSRDGVLSLNIVNVIEFSRKNLGKYRGSPVCKLKHIKVKDLHNLASLSCEDLIDGLLWRFRPEAITIILAKERSEYIEVIQNHLNGIGEASKCCNLTTSRCWRHDLKRAEIELSSRVSKKRPYRDLVEFKLKFQWNRDEISMGLKWRHWSIYERN